LNPDDPPLHIKEALDQLSIRFGDFERLKTWTEIEWENLSKRLTIVERRVESLEQHQQRSLPRKLDASLTQQLGQVFPNGYGKKIDVTCVMGDQEAYRFAHEIVEHLKSRRLSVEGVNQAIFDKPIIGQGIELNSDPVRIVIGGKP
jgi:hypothetical protein